MNQVAKLKPMAFVICLLLVGMALGHAQAFQSGRPQTPTPPTFPSDQTRQAPTPSPLMGSARWEYRIVYAGGGVPLYVSKPSGRYIELEEELNALGTQGFEVHSVTPTEGQGATVGLSVLLKRPKS